MSSTNFTPPMTPKEILSILSFGPKSGNELSTPVAVAKMQAVGWIKFDRQNRVWKITRNGRNALEGKE